MFAKNMNMRYWIHGDLHSISLFSQEHCQKHSVLKIGINNWSICSFYSKKDSAFEL